MSGEETWSALFDEETSKAKPVETETLSGLIKSICTLTRISDLYAQRAGGVTDLSGSKIQAKDDATAP